MYRESDELAAYRKFATDAAKDLLYDEDVLDKLRLAETTGEISRIMVAAREEKFKNEN